MFRSLICVGMAVALIGCRDETLSGFASPEQVFVLQEMDGQKITIRTTLRFPEPGRIAGSAPCNSYSGTLAAPYPWFETGPIAASRRACSHLRLEVAFFAALADMTLAEISGNTLILSNDAGRQMVFRAP